MLNNRLNLRISNVVSDFRIAWILRRQLTIPLTSHSFHHSHIIFHTHTIMGWKLWIGVKEDGTGKDELFLKF